MNRNRDPYRFDPEAAERAWLHQPPHSCRRQRGSVDEPSWFRLLLIAAIAFIVVAAVVALFVRDANGQTPPVIPGWHLIGSTTRPVTATYAPDPPPATRPVIRPAPARAAYPNGIASFNHTADQVIRDAYVRGQSRNIVAQEFKGKLLIDNVVSVDALGTGQYDGQGCYLDDIAGGVTIQNSYFGYNGRSRLPGAFSPSQYSQDVYNNATGKTGPLRVTHCILATAANAGVQTRTLAGSEIDHCVILDCGTGILNIMGVANVHDCLIYGGNYYWDGNGWTGGTALKSYDRVLANNNVILSRPDQGAVPQSTTHPATVAWPQCGVNLGGKWVHSDPSWTPPAGYPNIGNYMSGGGNTISSDWPHPANGLVWYSSGKNEATKIAGWAVSPPGPAYDYTPVLKAVEDGGSVPDAIAVLRHDLLEHE